MSEVFKWLRVHVLEDTVYFNGQEIPCLSTDCLESIPQAEPAQEWSPEIQYPIWTALHYADKYGLELSWGSLSVWHTKQHFLSNAHIPSNFNDRFSLRKPITLDDKLREILTNSSYSNPKFPANFTNDTIQAIKDVFKEEK